MLIKRVQQVQGVLRVQGDQDGIGLLLLKIHITLIHSVETARFHWFWRQYGKGQKILLAFHGFNRSPDDFHSFEKWLGDDYTILAFDLFFHGKSVVKDNEHLPAFNRAELKEVIELVLERFGRKNFELIAHSYGGRLAMNCVEIFGSRVEGLYLMAPDAMRFNPGYWFATQSALGRKIMRKYRHNPEPVLKFMRLLAKLGLYSEKAIEFYISHVNFEPMREKVYKVWMAHRHTVVSRKHVTEIISKNNIRTLLFFGKYDSIIPPSLGIRFAKEAGSSAKLHILEIGHRVHEKNKEISEIILR